MNKWLKTGTLKRSASRTEIRTTDLAAMEITVDQQDDNHEVQRPTDWLFRRHKPLFIYVINHSEVAPTLCPIRLLLSSVPTLLCTQGEKE
ncbi:hypothetical protein AVEN_207367-1, partial [Araneus ventricosus]